MCISREAAKFLAKVKEHRTIGQRALGKSSLPQVWSATYRASTRTSNIRRLIRPTINEFTFYRTHALQSHEFHKVTRSLATSNGPSENETENEISETVDQGLSQRPIRTSSDQFKQLCKQLQSLPNVITTLRILSAPYISYLIVTERYELAFYCSVAAGMSDILDGYLARHFSMSTVLGTYLDPLADKVIINVLAASLWYNEILPTPIVTLWLIRDVALMMGTYIYVRTNTGNGQWVVNPVTTPLKVEPTTISKINTGLQFLTLSTGMLQPICSIVPPQVFIPLW
jgi:phosphatidylglycerophosphate synthase